MKKTWIIAVCVLTLLILCGCTAAEQTDVSETELPIGSVTFVNGVTEADVWLLPETEANPNTTVWGTATAAGVKQDESRPVPLCAPGENGLYMLRMIDVEGFFYSVDGLELKADWTLRITENEQHDVTLEVLDEAGTVVNTYEVFAAKL